jgi:hypothetical protein
MRVENGRIKLDEPTNLPNGKEAYVVPVDELEDVVLTQDDVSTKKSARNSCEASTKGLRTSTPADSLGTRT